MFIQQIAIFELRIPQPGVGGSIAQRLLLGRKQDGVGQEGALFKDQGHHGVKSRGVVCHQRALAGVDEPVHGAVLW
ncbi:hypothetical protein D3C71_1903570 [compost metagenome]